MFDILAQYSQSIPIFAIKTIATCHLIEDDIVSMTSSDVIETLFKSNAIHVNWWNPVGNGRLSLVCQNLLLLSENSCWSVERLTILGRLLRSLCTHLFMKMNTSRDQLRPCAFCNLHKMCRSRLSLYDEDCRFILHLHGFHGVYREMTSMSGYLRSQNFGLTQYLAAFSGRILVFSSVTKRLTGDMPSRFQFHLVMDGSGIFKNHLFSFAYFSDVTIIFCQSSIFWCCDVVVDDSSLVKIATITLEGCDSYPDELDLVLLIVSTLKNDIPWPRVRTLFII